MEKQKKKRTGKRERKDNNIGWEDIRTCGKEAARRKVWKYINKRREKREWKDNVRKEEWKRHFTELRE